MASYAETVARMMRQYPTLFPTEAHALHHLFIVNGNGYDWIEGQLVDLFARSDEEVRAERCRREERLLHGVAEDLRAQIKAAWAKPAAPIIQLYASANMQTSAPCRTTSALTGSRRRNERWRGRGRESGRSPIRTGCSKPVRESKSWNSGKPCDGTRRR